MAIDDFLGFSTEQRCITGPLSNQEGVANKATKFRIGQIADSLSNLH